MAVFDIFGDKDFDKIEKRIDKLMNTIPDDISEEPVEDATGKFMDVFLQKMPEDEVGNLFGNIQVPKDRLARYNVYEELLHSVPMIKRVLRVFIANLLQKNPVTGKSIIIRESEKVNKLNEDDKDRIISETKKFAEEVIEKFGLTHKLKYKILPKQLSYGDCFIEVININQVDLKTDLCSLNPMHLMESKKLNQTTEKIESSSYYENGLEDIDHILEKAADCFIDPIIEDYQNLSVSEVLNEQLESPQDSESETSSSDNSQATFRDIILKIHKPHRIIKLETMYGTLIGYLEVLFDDTPKSFDITQNLSAVIGRVTRMMCSRGKVTQEALVNRLVYFIVKKLLCQGNQEQLVDNLDPEIFKFIKRMVIEQGLHEKEKYHRLKVKFISPERMIPFTVHSPEYEPYGESIVDPLIFPGKLYILAQLSNVITKLSRASLIRKWTIEQIKNLSLELFSQFYSLSRCYFAKDFTC